MRKRIVAGLDEAFEMMEQTGAAPGAKWGDLTSAIYTASGDLAHISTGGVLAFAAVVHYPVRFIKKYWIDEPTVGVRDGDGFIHNDARYGNIHNTDQSMIVPVFYEGELIAWRGHGLHEGENGAKEPGGMPSSSESGLRRRHPHEPVQGRREQRDPPRSAHLPAELGARAKAAIPGHEGQAVRGAADQGARAQPVREVGRDNFIASLRKSLEDVEAEGPSPDHRAARRHLPSQLLLGLDPA